MRARQRRGFTLVEMLVVIAIIAMLVALLLPAVQAAREASRRMSCSNNLHQIGLAFHNFAEANSGFPPGRTTKPVSHSWVVSILPFVEAEPLRKDYRYDKHAYAPENQEVVRTPLEFMQCPSSPDHNRLVSLSTSDNTIFGANGDYWVHAGPVVALDAVTYADSPLTAKHMQTSERVGVRSHTVPMSFISDGLGQTILVHELAMWPEHWIMGEKQTDTLTRRFGAWAWCPAQGPVIFSADGKTARSTVPEDPSTEADFPCAVNCNNYGGSYAFHPAGANVLFADGSVHFFSKRMSSSVYLALCSANGDEKVASGSY